MQLHKKTKGSLRKYSCILLIFYVLLTDMIDIFLDLLLKIFLYGAVLLLLLLLLS